VRADRKHGQLGAALDDGRRPGNLGVDDCSVTLVDRTHCQTSIRFDACCTGCDLRLFDRVDSQVRAMHVRSGYRRGLSGRNGRHVKD